MIVLGERPTAKRLSIMAHMERLCARLDVGSGQKEGEGKGVFFDVSLSLKYPLDKQGAGALGPTICAQPGRPKSTQPNKQNRTNQAYSFSSALHPCAIGAVVGWHLRADISHVSVSPLSPKIRPSVGLYILRLTCISLLIYTLWGHLYTDGDFNGIAYKYIKAGLLFDAITA